MKRLLFALLFAVAALGQNDPVSRSWNQPVQPFRIAGKLYYVGATDITSCLIATPKGHIVIDGGFVETAPMILANIRALGFDPKDVRILLNSHAHYDHAGGLAELKRVTGATFYASRGDIPQLARGGLDDPQHRGQKTSCSSAARARRVFRPRGHHRGQEKSGERRGVPRFHRRRGKAFRRARGGAFPMMASEFDREIWISCDLDHSSGRFLARRW